MTLAAKARRRMEKRIRKAQFHHITYKPERVVPVFRGEHQVLTLIQRMAYSSYGFFEAIDFELKRLRSKPAIILNRDVILALRANRKKKKYESRKRKKADRKNLLAQRKQPSDARISKATVDGDREKRPSRTTRTRSPRTAGV